MSVYFIRVGAAGPVKIGSSRFPQVRLAEFQPLHPEPLALLRTLPGALAEERAFHRHYAALHIRGEWFHYDASMLTTTQPPIEPRQKAAPRKKPRAHPFKIGTSGWRFTRSVERFLRRSGLSPRQLGIQALGDDKFVARLRDGQGITLTNVVRVEEFMADYEPPRVS